MSEQKTKKTLTIVKIGKADTAKTPIKATEDGVEGVFYVWNKTLADEKQAPLYAEGVTAEFTVEDKPYQNKPQLFIWRPQGGGGGRGGGGVAKADPLKMEGQKLGNHLNNSAAAMQCAVTILGPGQDINAYREVALDLCKAMVENCTAFKGMK